MGNIDSINLSTEGDDKVTHAQFGEKFAILREEATERAVHFRQRMQRAADASTLAEAPSGLACAEPQPLRAEPEDRVSFQQASNPFASHAKGAGEVDRHQERQDFDLIALWSVVGPSTITAVFAGVAMSSGNVPLPYAIAFIFAWFTLTSALAIGVLKLFNTKQCAALLRASGARLGMAAVSCALIAVLAVEAARLSITAMAGPAPQQVGQKQTAVTPPVLSALAEKASRPEAARKSQVASAQSIHFPSTPSVVSAAAAVPARAASIDDTVTSLPTTIPQTSLEVKKAGAAALPRRPQRANDKLLGSISAKGKFLTHRSSSRWSGGAQKTAAKRKRRAPDTRNILERIFNPIINSANAKAPTGRVGTSAEDLAEISR